MILAFYFEVVRWTELDLWNTMKRISAFSIEREDAAGYSLIMNISLPIKKRLTRNESESHRLMRMRDAGWCVMMELNDSETVFVVAKTGLGQRMRHYTASPDYSNLRLNNEYLQFIFMTKVFDFSCMYEIENH
jgi:hypothetical protein